MSQSQSILAGWANRALKAEAEICRLRAELEEWKSSVLALEGDRARLRAEIAELTGLVKRLVRGNTHELDTEAHAILAKTAKEEL